MATEKPVVTGEIAEMIDQYEYQLKDTKLSSENKQLITASLNASISKVEIETGGNFEMLSSLRRRHKRGEL